MICDKLQVLASLLLRSDREERSRSRREQFMSSRLQHQQEEKSKTAAEDAPKFPKIKTWIGGLGAAQGRGAFSLFFLPF